MFLRGQIRTLASAVLWVSMGWAAQTPEAGAHPAGFTLPQVMSAPFPSSLVAAPRGQAVAWVFNQQGCRNVWVADADGNSHAITQFKADDGFDIGEVAWSADARWIAFTRAGDLEAEAPANITSAPSGPAPQEVWVVSADGANARKIAAGHQPVFSPDGTQLLFLDNGRLMSASVAGEPAPQPMIVDMGKLSDVTWSAEGRRLAFISHRAGHAIVGVYDTQHRAIVWLSPSLDDDQSPVFSPDGTRVAFIRVPSEKTPIFVSHRSGQPWSIWVADAASGQGRPVWVAQEGRGSVFAPSQLDYREAEAFGPAGSSELKDLLGSISYLQSRKDVDRARIGIWGASYGGLMTALGLARASGSLAAGVDYAGVHNWVTMLASIGLAVEPGEATRVAFESSALATVDQWKSPVLIVQADDDRSVPAAQSVELIEALRQRKVEHETLIIPNEIHDLILGASWITFFTASDEYFARKLGGG